MVDGGSPRLILVSATTQVCIYVYSVGDCLLEFLKVLLSRFLHV